MFGKINMIRMIFLVMLLGLWMIPDVSAYDSIIKNREQYNSYSNSRPVQQEKKKTTPAGDALRSYYKSDAYKKELKNSREMLDNYSEAMQDVYGLKKKQEYAAPSRYSLRKEEKKPPAFPEGFLDAYQKSQDMEE